MDEVFARDPSAVAVIESALIFEVVRDARARGEKDSVLADWRRRIDRIIVVTAPDELKIARYAARVARFGRRSRADAAPVREAIEADARNALRTRFPTRKRPRRPTMCLIIQAIWSAARAGRGALAAPEGREQQIRRRTCL